MDEIIFDTTFVSTDDDFTISYTSTDGDFNTEFDNEGISRLSPATREILGGIIVGENLLVTKEGILSIDVSSKVEASNRPLNSEAVIEYVGEGDEAISNLEIDKILGII